MGTVQVQGEKVKAVLTGVASQHQMQTTSSTASKLKYRGLLRTVYIIGAEEGVTALYGGLVAALQRQLVFASIRLGYYDKVKHFYIEQFYGRHTLINTAIVDSVLCPRCALPSSFPGR